MGLLGIVRGDIGLMHKFFIPALKVIDSLALRQKILIKTHKINNPPCDLFSIIKTTPGPSHILDLNEAR